MPNDLWYPKNKRITLFLYFIMIIFINPIIFSYSKDIPDSYKIDKYWSKTKNYRWHNQVALNSCGPACVQMVLDYYNIIFIPSQKRLAIEMNTTIDNYTYTNFLHLPFDNRNITIIFEGNLSENFEVACDQLKGNISLNRPIIILMWYDHLPNSTGHYRLLTGYNQTGFFFHDPACSFNSIELLYSGPNIYFNNTYFKRLWTKYDHWAMITESDPKISHNFQSNLLQYTLLLIIFLIPFIIYMKFKNYNLRRKFIIY